MSDEYNKEVAVKEQKMLDANEVANALAKLDKVKLSIYRDTETGHYYVHNLYTKKTTECEDILIAAVAITQAFKDKEFLRGVDMARSDIKLEGKSDC